MAELEGFLLVITLSFLAFLIFPSETADQGEATLIGSFEVSVPILSIDASGKGILGHAYVHANRGTGMALVDLSGSFPDSEAQASAAAAAKAAFSVTGTDADVTYRFDMPAYVATGPSAGAALAVATVAAVRGAEITDGIAITGAIDDRGDLTAATGIIEKARAAKAAGFSVVLIPSRGGPDVGTYKKTMRCEWAQGAEMCSTEYVADTDALSAMTGMEIKPVFNLTEALGYMIGGQHG